MDIAKFNKELGTTIAKAKSYEKHNDIEAAIEIWIKVSEMTIRASKNPQLDASFRHMLISRTEQIIEHIKNLKSPKVEEIIEEEIISPEDIIQEPEVIEIINDLESKSTKINHNEPLIDKPNNIEPSGLNDDNWFEKADDNKLSEGFKEIEPSRDFKIITPHDPFYVEKMKNLSEDVDMSIFKKQEEKPADQEKDNSGDKVICFACGALLPPNTEICKDCGTKLN